MHYLVLLVFFQVHTQMACRFDLVFLSLLSFSLHTEHLNEVVAHFFNIVPSVDADTAIH